MVKKQMTVAQLRNLPQYRDLTDEELEKVRDKVLHGDSQNRIERVIENFKTDYDLSEMTANDHLALLELARIFVMLEDIETSLQHELAGDTDWVIFEKINRAASTLRDDASKFQRDLSITRKARQDTGTSSVVDFIEDVKSRAKKFMERVLTEIYCPECKMLLAKVWCLYPNLPNKLTFVCGRGGCEYSFTVNTEELTKRKNVEAGPPR